MDNFLNTVSQALPKVFELTIAAFLALFSKFLIDKLNLGGTSFKNLKSFNEINDSKLDKPFKDIVNKYIKENLIYDIYKVYLKWDQLKAIEKSGLTKKYNWRQIRIAINFFKFEENTFEIKIGLWNKIRLWSSLIISLFLILLGFLSIVLDISLSKSNLVNKSGLQSLTLIILGFLIMVGYHTPPSLALEMKKYLLKKSGTKPRE